MWIQQTKGVAEMGERTASRKVISLQIRSLTVPPALNETIFTPSGTETVSRISQDYDTERAAGARMENAEAFSSAGARSCLFAGMVLPDQLAA